MTGMVERVAKALCRHAYPGRTLEEHLAPDVQLWMRLIPEARIAIEAMREPTESMGDQIIYSQLETIQQGEDLWRSMIDAALEAPALSSKEGV